MLLGAPDIATSNKKLLGAPGLTTRNKNYCLMLFLLADWSTNFFSLQSGDLMYQKRHQGACGCIKFGIPSNVQHFAAQLQVKDRGRD